MTRPGPDLDLVGRTLDGRYRVEALLGQGGMGAVFRATHIHMGQRVALKVLRPHLVGDPVAARRFAREAKGTFRLDSEHAVKVADFGATEDGLLYLVMEYLDGRTVADELAVDGPLAPARAVRIAAQVCDAVAAAHRLGFIHRDLKPENVMLVRRGDDPDVVKVLDFGLAKLVDPRGGGPFSVAALTQHGIVFGTPEYMAPEQAMGHELDGRADLYAVGATLFEMLTGRPPFVADSAMRLLAQHVKAPAPRLVDTAPWLAAPPPLEAIVASCLAKDPAARPATADALAAALRALAPALATATPRVPAALASSATVDLAVPELPRSPADRAVPELPRSPADRAVPELPRSPADLAVPELPRSGPVTRSSRRVAVAFVIAAVGLGAIVVLALTREVPGSRSGSGSTSGSASMPDGAQASGKTATTGVPEAGGTDAGLGAIAHTPPDAGASAADPAAREVPPSGGTAARDPGVRERDPVDPVIARHLAAAEGARRSGERLRQLAEADAVLRRDRRHLRARFLMGEALVETGDVANGCTYLRSARRLREARALLEARGCPAD